MNSADWAMIPADRKSRYGTSPEGIARSRVKVCPNTTSQRTGWIIRVNSSDRSCLSFCSSTRQKVATRKNSRVPSTHATGRSARDTDTAQPSLLLPGELVAGPVAEDVLERGGGSEGGLELVRRPFGADRPLVHERDPVAE